MYAPCLTLLSGADRRSQQLCPSMGLLGFIRIHLYAFGFTNFVNISIEFIECKEESMYCACRLLHMSTCVCDARPLCTCACKHIDCCTYSANWRPRRILPWSCICCLTCVCVCVGACVSIFRFKVLVSAYLCDDIGSPRNWLPARRGAAANKTASRLGGYSVKEFASPPFTFVVVAM